MGACQGRRPGPSVDREADPAGDDGQEAPDKDRLDVGGMEPVHRVADLAAAPVQEPVRQVDILGHGGRTGGDQRIAMQVALRLLAMAGEVRVDAMHGTVEYRERGPLVSVVVDGVVLAGTRAE